MNKGVDSIPRVKIGIRIISNNFPRSGEFSAADLLLALKSFFQISSFLVKKEAAINMFLRVAGVR